MPGEIRVLYVDDEPGLLEIAQLFLEQSGEFRVGTMTSAGEALRDNAILSFDAIISDYQMPDMDGIAFLKEVRARFGDIPFILFTGRGREEVVIEAINYGADFYLQKGGDPTSQFAELSHKIKQAVARKKAELSLIESEKRLTDIINFLPDATFAIDKAGTVIAWNRAIEEMTGIPAAEMLSKGDYEYAIPFYGNRRKILIDLVFEPEETVAKNYARIKREKDVLTAETNLPRPRGKALTLFGKASPLYNQQGEIVGAIEAIRDITQREQDAAKIAQKTSALSIINRIIQASNQQRSLDEYAKNVLSLTIDLLNYDAGGIYFVDPGRQIARIVCAESLNPEFIRQVDNIDIRQAPYDALFVRGEPVIIENLETVLPQAAAVSGLHAIASIPIVSQDSVIGALNVASRKQSLISADEREILLTIGKELGSAVTRIKAELSLKESEERLRLFIRLAPAALAMFDKEMRYIAASRRWMNDYHLRDEDIAGRSHYEIFPEISEDLKAIHRRSLSGEALSSDEDRFVREDGSVQWIAWDVRPWYLTGDVIGGIIISSEDITERKNAEAALRESEEKYRSLVEKANEAIVIIQDMRIVYANPRMADLAGIPAGELPGMDFSDTVWPEDRDMVITRYWQRCAGEVVPETYDFRLIGPGGKPRWIYVSIAKIPWQGRPATINLMTDITERKLAEAALRESGRRLNLLNSITRHDIVNQLAKIQGFTRIAAKHERDPVLSGHLAKIDEGASTIRRQIEFMRTYQELGTGAPGWFPLGGTVAKTEMRGVTLSGTCNGIEIYSDPMLEKVFFNLFENAMRHGEHVTEIAVRCEESGAGLVITVEDNGIGIAPGEKEKIFEKGFGKNTGFGLFLAKEILSITGITIRETGTTGKGARFEITVPKGMYRLVGN